MADRDFEINVRVSGESGDFQRNIDGVQAGVKSLASELRDLNSSLLGTRTESSRAADNLQKVGTQSGYAARALGSLTRYTRMARDQLQLLSSSAKDSRNLLGELDGTTKMLADAQQNLARRLDSVVIPAFNREADVLNTLSRRLIMTGAATGDLAREQREAALAAEAEAAALDDVGESADKAAAKLTLLSMAQASASRASIAGRTSAGPVMGAGGDGGGTDWRSILYHRGIGGRLPWWLGGAFLGTAGAGGLLPMGGLGPERLITTPLAIGASAIPALGGAAAIGLGAAGTLAVGGGSDMAVMKSTIADTKTLFTNYENLKQAVETYGAKSRQAAQAQAQLNFQMKTLGPAAGVELALAKQVVKLNVLWDQVTAKARGAAVNILDQVVSLAHDYVGRVASAAYQNLTIINQDIKPLFAWLQGPQGVAIWNNLESKFKQDLPIAIDAFKNGLELLLRIVNISSQYVGGFLRTIDGYLAKWNGYSDLRLSKIIQHLVDDFRIWERFIKSAGVAIYELFHNASSEGLSVLELFTKWLDKFDQWAKTIQGQNWLHTFFTNRKNELIELIKFLGQFIAGWGRLYIAVQPLVPVFTTILHVLNSVFSALTKISPAIATAIAAYVMFGKYVGFGKINAGIGTIAGIRGATTAVAGASSAAETAAMASAATAGVIKLDTRAVVGAAEHDIMGGGFGAAVSTSMEGGMVGGLTRGLAKVGPLLKVGAAFWLGTGIITGFSQGFSGSGNFFEKLGNSIQDTATAAFGKSLGHTLLQSIPLGPIPAFGSLIFPDTAGPIASAKQLSSDVISSLNTVAQDSSWKQVAIQLDTWKHSFGDIGPPAARSLNEIQTAVDNFRKSVGGLTDVTPAQASKIIGSFQSIKNEGGSSIQNLEATVAQNMTNIKNDIGTKSAQGKEALVLNFGTAAAFMEKNYNQMGVSTTKAADFIDQMIFNASQLGSGYFSKFVNNMTGAERAMLANTNKGMAALTKVVNDHLRSLQVSGIPPSQWTTAMLTSYVPANLIHGNPGAAHGALIQVGRAGDRGPDAIPMSVGGTNIVVGSGEQVAVMNHDQQQFLNSRLSDVGGLPGVFQRVTRPHYMAGGGLLPTVRGPVSTFGPPGEAAHSMATGPMDTIPAIALRIPGTSWDDARNRALLHHNFRVSIGGHSAILPDLDLGPNQSTGRDIDVTGAGVAALGIPYSSFPTNAIGTATPTGGTSGIVSAAFAGLPSLIPSPQLKGGGAFGRLGQAALNKVTAAANRYIQQQEAKLQLTSGASAFSPNAAAYAKFGGKGSHAAYAALIPGRTDQGVDFGGVGPVYSVLPGKVMSTGIWPGWPPTDKGLPGGGGVVYSTPRGNVYIMEGFTPAVFPGEMLKADQLVGIANGQGGTGIETGWANASGTGPLTPYNGAGDGTPMPGGIDFRSFIGYKLGGIIQAMMASGGYPHKSHTTPSRQGHGNHHKQPKISTTGHRAHSHFPKVKHIPALPGLNPGFEYLYNTEAYMEPVVKGWPVQRPSRAEFSEGLNLLAGGSGFTGYFTRHPRLETYMRGQGGNAQAIQDAQGFMGLLTNELSLIQDTDSRTNAPLTGAAYSYGSHTFYPNDPANPKGYIGAWKIDQQIAGDLGILAMMRLQKEGSQDILGHSLPKYVKHTKHSLHSYVHRGIEELNTIAKIQSYQRYTRVKDNPALKLSEDHKIHDEFTKARAKLHIKEIKGKYSADTAYNLARGVVAQTRADSLKSLAAANILDPTQESIAAAGIEGAYSTEVARLNQLRNSMLEKKQISWARASMFLSLAEQDALYGIQHSTDVLQHRDTIYSVTEEEVRAKYDKTKKDAELLASDLFAADSGSINGHLAKNLARIGWSKDLSPTFGGTDIRSEIVQTIQGLEDPANGIPAYRHFIIPQLEQQRNQITGASGTGSADQTQLVQLLEQQLAFRAADFAVAEQQLRALRSFTPVLGSMVGSFAGGTLSGRVIPETGYALVHRGETISPDPEGPFGTQGNAGQGDVHVEAPVYLSLYGGMRMLEEFVDARIEKTAPRIVNSTLGKRGRLISNARVGR